MRGGGIVYVLMAQGKEMTVGHEKGFYLYLYLLRICGRRFSLYVVGMVGGRGEGWATVICPSINCQGGAGPWLTPSKDPTTQDTKFAKPYEYDRTFFDI